MFLRVSSSFFLIPSFHSISHSFLILGMTSLTRTVPGLASMYTPEGLAVLDKDQHQVYFNSTGSGKGLNLNHVLTLASNRRVAYVGKWKYKKQRYRVLRFQKKLLLGWLVYQTTNILFGQEERSTEVCLSLLYIYTYTLESKIFIMFT